MALRLHDDGTLDLHSVDDLSPDALSDWIWARLHNEDTAVPDDPRQDVGQYYLVGSIYEDLQPGTQAEVRRILKRFLRQLEDGDDDWEGRPGHALLLLVMDVQEPDLAPPIRRMAEREQFLPEDEDLHARLVQALVFLGEKVTPEFWKNQIERNPARYAALAFSGLLMHSLYQALGVLGRLDLEDEGIQTKLYPALRGLLASKYTRDDLRAVLRDFRDILPESTFAFITRALPELGMDAEDVQEQDRYSEARDVLRASIYLDRAKTFALLQPDQALQALKDTWSFIMERASAFERTQAHVLRARLRAQQGDYAGAAEDAETALAFYRPREVDSVWSREAEEILEKAQAHES